MNRSQPTDQRRIRKRRFLSRISESHHFDRLFNHLRGVSFFAKDQELCLIAANKEFWSRLHVTSEDELIGMNDFELFPRRLAENFRRDDLEVMKSGQAKLDILELFFDSQGLPDWFLTNKFPILDHHGTAIGVMGTVRSFSTSHEALSPYLELDRVVEHLRSHFTEPVLMADLAKLVGMSVRQFNRRFKEAFNTTPQSFLIKTRIQAACERLRSSDKPIGELALELGFYDQSSFTLHFRKHMGMTPLRYRRSG